MAELSADLKLLNQMFAADFDWEVWWGGNGDEPEDVFRRCYKWHDYREGPCTVDTVKCSGVEFKDTPDALYRVLHLLQPSGVDFSGMYKTGTLVDFSSPDGKFVCSFQLHKYEACLRFYCAPEFAKGTPAMIQGGWASCDNGIRCVSDEGNEWFKTAVTALTRRWSIYSGNNFSV